MRIFDGRSFARRRERALLKKLEGVGERYRILSVFFAEDRASQLYTRLKLEAARRVGMSFDRLDLSILDDLEFLREQIRMAGRRDDVDGVLVQKPSKRVWESLVGKHGELGDNFRSWWLRLVSELRVEKDIDCLTEENLSRVYEGNWRILPATVRAVLHVLQEVLGDDADYTMPVETTPLAGMKATVIGRSRIVGHPLAAVLSSLGAEVTNVGSGEPDLASVSREADILVSATGRRGLVKGEMVKRGVIAIDVGSPEGDMEFASVASRARMITPVPNGIGPVTVVSLLENMFILKNGLDS